MATEPNNAEEQLKRYAAERRKDAPVELHPADRAMLQGEVARVYGQRRAAKPFWRRWLLGSELGWAIALIGILTISFWTLRQPPHKEEHDAVKSAPPAQPAQAPVTTPAENKPAAETRAAASPKPEPAPVVVQPEPPRTVAPMSAATAPTRARAEALPDVRQKKVEVTKAAAPASKPAGQVGAADELQLSFSNSAPPPTANIAGQNALDTKNAKDLFANNGPSVVLNRFTMRQTGSRIQFEEADGSKYEGSVSLDANGNNAFRTRGTNRTLRMPVDFTGNLYLNNAAQNNANQQRQLRLAPDQPRIQGQAVVGTSNQIQVDAEAAPAR
jgi:hypothetical protein